MDLELDRCFGDVLRVVRGISIESLTVDPSLRHIHAMKYNLGVKAVELVLQGLSRLIKPTRENVELLISEWERRDNACCYTGTVSDLLSHKGTIIIALSYKHDDIVNWNRKGENIISKMAQADQEEFIESILGLGRFPNTSAIMVWCDQVMSTRLSGQERSNIAWCNAGLLPYVCLPVLTLSTRILEADLEKRIWIKAERSLGSLGTGLLSVSDAKLGILSHRQSQYTHWEVLKNISHLILSGYWPEDTGFWENDYKQMKQWALGLVCRFDGLKELQVHEQLRPVDNIEVLANIHHLSMVPQGVEHKERSYYTSDRAFFLKPTAWNLSLDEVWNKDSSRISHYLGRSENYRFSWWIEAKSQNICGFIASMERACIVLANKNGSGYDVFRRGMDPLKYRHKEATLGSGMKNIIEETARYFGVRANVDSDWSLLFFCDECIDTNKTEKAVKKLIGHLDSDADALVPYQFVGQTTSIYRVAGTLARLNGGKSGFSPERFLSLFEEWNSYVKRKYNNWISVRDTHSGPAWLEGYNEENVSFGFLDFITRYLITGEKVMSERVIKLPSKWEALEEIRRAAAEATNDLKVIAEELFGSITHHTCEEEITTADVAILMVSGGFTSGFGNDRLASFLKKGGWDRGYWTTRIYCKEGKMQILFLHESGDTRIIQRETNLGEFIAEGIVHPEDSSIVTDLADKLNEDPDVYRGYKYWKDGMKDTMSKTEMEGVFSTSRRRFNGKDVGTVDMTVLRPPGIELYSVHDVCDENSAESRQNQRTQIETILRTLLSKAPKERQEAIAEEMNALASGASKEFPTVGSTFEEKQKLFLNLRKERQEPLERANLALMRHHELKRDIEISRKREEEARILEKHKDDVIRQSKEQER